MMSNEFPQAQRELIIDGRDAVRGRYPYFTTLQRNCGGALIAPSFVLTAGHCMPSLKRNNPLPTVRVGTYSFHPQDNDDYEEFAILNMTRHPDFVHVGDDEFRYDFLLLQLNGTSTKPPLAINRDGDIPSVDGQEVVAMGMGFTEPTGHRADVLQEVTLHSISNEVCSAARDPARHNLAYKDRIMNHMMCTTGGPNNERDACSYDSGSPIILGGREPQEDLLVALVSWGEECADPQFPGVNARVSDVSQWIDVTVCSMSSSSSSTAMTIPSSFGCHFPESTAARTTPVWPVVVALAAIVVASVAIIQRFMTRKKYLSDEEISLSAQEIFWDSSETESGSESYGSIHGVEVA